MKTLLIFAMIATLTACNEDPAETATLYRGWSKLHPEAKLTQEEFQALREARLLPGQSAKTDDGAAEAALSATTAATYATIAATRK